MDDKVIYQDRVIVLTRHPDGTYTLSNGEARVKLPALSFDHYFTLHQLETDIASTARKAIGR
ncbi:MULTISPECIES: hypothetical protein [unclassified Beijerinckia]|uniref:hypothetical protein n=1 Tax=unclassified Beijerinckia TaxID=2638183 RepID=UPI00089B88F1|nr:MULTISPECIES: hypothetical protein [unclassified Beijerinckia]MDH7796414.1 hypothetical protein [Beijerinckia sp. GAS462]SEC44069.1 hypothetical protein SAMN05443249_2696 [Beijerinckia sp. 28-YEA-48]